MSNIVLCNTTYGKFLLNPEDEVSKSIIDGNLWEEELLEVFKTYLIRDSIAIEVGSYIGDHTVYLSKLCKLVYAYEGDKKTYPLLVVNLLLNDCNNVETFNCIVGNGESVRPAHLHGDQFANNWNHNPSGVRFIEDAGGNKSIPLDSLHFPDRVDMIKIDAEGMDLSVMMGAVNLINRDHPVIVFEYNSPITNPFDGYSKFLNSVGYEWEKISRWNWIATWKGEAL